MNTFNNTSSFNEKIKQFPGVCSYYKSKIQKILVLASSPTWELPSYVLEEYGDLLNREYMQRQLGWEFEAALIKQIYQEIDIFVEVEPVRVGKWKIEKFLISKA